MTTTSNYFAIELDTVNAAFVDDGMPEAELGRILNKAALRIAGFGTEQDYSDSIYDINGAKVGNMMRLECSSEPEFIKQKLGDFNIVMRCEGAAFFTDTEQPDNREIARIVHEIASNLEHISDLTYDGSTEPFTVMDINGNTVGRTNWCDYVKPEMNQEIKAIIDSAESKLSFHIDPAEVFSFKASLINDFFSAHSLHSNPLSRDGMADDYTAAELDESIGDYFSLDPNELMAALLTFEHQGNPNPEALQGISDKIIEYAREEVYMIGYEDEQNEIEQAIQAFKFPEKAEITPALSADPCF